MSEYSKHALAEIGKEVSFDLYYQVMVDVLRISHGHQADLVENLLKIIEQRKTEEISRRNTVRQRRRELTKAQSAPAIIAEVARVMVTDITDMAKKRLVGVRRVHAMSLASSFISSAIETALEHFLSGTEEALQSSKLLPQTL